MYWGAGSDCQYSGSRRGIGGIMGHLGCRGVWANGGIRAVGVSGLYWDGKWTGSPTTLGPVQGPSTPTGSPGGVTYLAKAKQVTEMSSAS